MNKHLKVHPITYTSERWVHVHRVPRACYTCRKYLWSWKAACPFMLCPEDSGEAWISGCGICCSPLPSITLIPKGKDVWPWPTLLFFFSPTWPHCTASHKTAFYLAASVVKIKWIKDVFPFIFRIIKLPAIEWGNKTFHISLDGVQWLHPICPHWFF